jgi:antibiotic biosynthesis monooxygenase (ABM) superfamily enzyme
MTGDAKDLNASGGTVVRPIRPSKIRLTIIMIGFVYPIVTLLLYALNPLADDWAVWHRTLVLTPVTVSLIVFVVSPAIAKHFDWFLRPRSTASKQRR